MSATEKTMLIIATAIILAALGIWAARGAIRNAGRK